MALLLAVVVAFTLVDGGAARWLVILAGVLVEVGEAVLAVRWSRRARSATGADALVGRAGAAVTDCRPEGRVRVDGEFWAARSTPGCAAGARVRVTAVEGLVLEVTPAGPAG